MRAIPEVVILRLPMYARALALREEQSIDFVSSRDLGEQLGITPAQIRKDLSYFGRFGRQGRGYNVRRLRTELRQILGLDLEWRMALIGVGRLGRALMDYHGFAQQGFRVVAALDKDIQQIGKRVGGIQVQNVAELGRVVKEQEIDMAIVAVPPAEAQTAIDMLVDSGVKAILNYAPIAARVPPDVRLRQIDPVLTLQSLTFYLKEKAASHSGEKK